MGRVAGGMDAMRRNERCWRFAQCREGGNKGRLIDVVQKRAQSVAFERERVLRGDWRAIEVWCYTGRGRGVGGADCRNGGSLWFTLGVGSERSEA